MIVPFDPRSFAALTHDTEVLARVGERMDHCAEEVAGHLRRAAYDLECLDVADALASLRRLAAYARTGSSA